MNLPGAGEEVIAQVAGQPITLQDVLDRLAAIRKGPLAPLLPASGPEDRRGRRWVLRLLVTESIVLHRAGLVPDHSSITEGGERSVNGADAARAGAVTTAAQGIFDEVTSGISIGEEELRSYYVRNLDRYRVPARRLIRHRLEETLEKARQAAARLASGAGDSPRWEIRRGELAGAFEDEVFRAQVGELIGPIESELGWHVALLEGIFDSGYQSFEGVRHEIEADLLSVARGRAFDQWLEQERRHLATVAPGWGHPGDPTLPDFSHRH